MSPVSTPAGVTFVRDDAKTPVWSIPPALAFMRDARARRKIVVFGTISDYVGNSDRKYIRAAREALAVADHVVFTGPNASKCLRAKRDSDGDALRAFYSVAAARDHLATVLQPGDLVLLKGGARDGLSELIPTTAPGGTAPARASLEAADADARPIRVVVGLGNPGPRYENTPHSIGYRIVDRLASSFGGAFTPSGEASVARIESDQDTVYLVKLAAMMNDSGPVLVEVATRLGLGAAECVLIHDDIDLPVGVVRVVERGGDGGHKGVRSVLHAFRTDAIRRVRVGVGRPEKGDRSVDHLLAPFSPADLPAIDAACEVAARHVAEMVGFRKGELV
jgi:aminoacyl-tRNA hydrolase